MKDEAIVVIKGKPSDIVDMLWELMNKQTPAQAEQLELVIETGRRTVLEVERIKRGWNKAQAGSYCLCSGSCYGSVARRKKAASKRLALAFSRAFDIPVNELFDDEGMALLS
jgi:hypothetical protein